MKEKIKKIIKPVFWGLFLAWNILLLFIITGKEEKTSIYLAKKAINRD